METAIGPDLSDHRILNEDDLQYAVFHHLQSFIDSCENADWRLRHRPYLPNVGSRGRFPDLLIAQRYIPRIVVELKDLVNRAVPTKELLDDYTKMSDILSQHPGIRAAAEVLTLPAADENLQSTIDAHCEALPHGEEIRTITVHLPDFVREADISNWWIEQQKLRELFGGRS